MQHCILYVNASRRGLAFHCCRIQVLLTVCVSVTRPTFKTLAKTCFYSILLPYRKNGIIFNNVRMTSTLCYGENHLNIFLSLYISTVVHLHTVYITKEGECPKENTIRIYYPLTVLPLAFSANFALHLLLWSTSSFGDQYLILSIKLSIDCILLLATSGASMTSCNT